jgi:putative heme-binding domain-containing protein
MKTPLHLRLPPALLLVASLLLSPGLARSSALETNPPRAAAERTISEEAALLQNGRLLARQKAFARLAKRRGAEVDELLLVQVRRFRNGELPPALWLDLFEAAAGRDHPELRAALAEHERELQQSKEPLARFRECLEGGDAEAGREVFARKAEAGCVRCHAVIGEGGAIGPDRTWLRHSMDRVRFLEALILPNATLALGFKPALLKLKNKEEIVGVVTFESPDDLVVTSVADGTKRKVKTADIAERTPLPSPMPPHFGTVLSKREIRDLVEFISEGD